MTIRYLDLVNGNDANDGTTFALRKKTLNSATYNSGDTVRVMASPDPTSLGQNATWTNQSDTVTLTTALTASIDDGTAWTASTNVTATASTSNYAEGTTGANLVVASAFATGLIAYKTLSATDYSAFQQVSLLIRTSVTLTAGALELRLCSDTAGVTAVDTFALPAITLGYWTAVVLDKAAALGAAIQSVALYAITDPGSNTITLDNIIACKAANSPDALTHMTLIGKNTDDTTEPWYAVDTIMGTTIKLGRARQATAAMGARGTASGRYGGSTETRTLYFFTPIQISAAQACATTSVTISGGWDCSDMSTQSGYSWIINTNPSLSVLSVSGALVNVSRICPVRAANTSTANALVFSGANCSWTDAWAVACYAAVRSTGGNLLIDVYGAISVRSAVMMSGSGMGQNYRFSFDKIHGETESTGSSTAVAIDLACTYGFNKIVLEAGEVMNFYIGTFGQNLSSIPYRLSIKNTTLNLTNILYAIMGGMVSNDLELYNCTGFNGSGAPGGYVYSKKHAGVDGDDRVMEYTNGDSVNVMQTATDQRHTASGYSWKYTAAISRSLLDPFVFPLAVIPCPAVETRTVTLWVRREYAVSEVRLRVRGGFIGGVPNDVTVMASGAIHTWEQIQLSFTPTERGAVQVVVEMGDTLGNVWIDDLAVV